MTIPENEFMTIEDEMTQVLEHLVELKQEIEQYRSSTQQLQDGTASLDSAGKAMSKQGEKMAVAMTTASTAIETAVQSLKPLGTVEIITAMQAMELRVSNAAEDIAGHLESFGEAATQMKEAASVTHSIPGKVTDQLSGMLEDQISSILNAIGDLDKVRKKETDVLISRIASVEKFVQEFATKSQQQYKQLLEAVEHSAPIGLLRRKKRK